MEPGWRVGPTRWTCRVGGVDAPAGYRFPCQVIAVAVRWYLRYGLFYRGVEGLLDERGISVDHVTTLLCLSSGNLGGCRGHLIG
jgi:hypothetical protein